MKFAATVLCMFVLIQAVVFYPYVLEAVGRRFRARRILKETALLVEELSHTIEAGDRQ